MNQDKSFESTLSKTKSFLKDLYLDAVDACLDDLIGLNYNFFESEHWGTGFKTHVDLETILENFISFLDLIASKTHTLIIKSGNDIFFEHPCMGGFYESDSGLLIVPFDTNGAEAFESLKPITFGDVDGEAVTYIDGAPFKKEKAASSVTIFEYLKSKGFVKKRDIISYADFLRSSFGEEQYQAIVGLADEWELKFNNLYEYPMSKIKDIMPDVFYKKIYGWIFNEKYNLNLAQNEMNLISTYLSNCEHSDEITKLIYTFAYTLTSFENEKQFCDYVDLTFILVSVFKVVEVVFSQLLNERFSHVEIIDQNNKRIDFSKYDLTLGEMKQFFYTNNSEIKSFLCKKNKLTLETRKLLGKWIHESRNGFLHKDIVEITNLSQLQESIQDSMQLLCNLILLFKI